MIRVNIHEAKTHFSRYIERVEQGEVVFVCRHNLSVAPENGAIMAGKKGPVVRLRDGHMRTRGARC